MFSNEEKITAIMSWHEDADTEQSRNFDPEFVEKMAVELEKKGELTGKQENALDNIVTGFNIDISEWA